MLDVGEGVVLASSIQASPRLSSQICAFVKTGMRRTVIHRLMSGNAVLEPNGVPAMGRPAYPVAQDGDRLESFQAGGRRRDPGDGKKLGCDVSPALVSRSLAGNATHPPQSTLRSTAACPRERVQPTLLSSAAKPTPRRGCRWENEAETRRRWLRIRQRLRPTGPPHTSAAPVPPSNAGPCSQARRQH